MSESCVEPPPTEEEGEVPAELTELRQRLHYLKKVFEDNFSQQKEDQERLEVSMVYQRRMLPCNCVNADTNLMSLYVNVDRER